MNISCPRRNLNRFLTQFGVVFFLFLLIFPQPVYANTEDLHADGAGGSNAWTGVTQANLALNDGDSSYAQSTNKNNTLYAALANSSGAGTINSVTVKAYAKTPTSGQTIALGMSDGTTEVWDAQEQPGTASYTLHTYQRTTNPAGGSWSWADVDNLQVLVDPDKGGSPSGDWRVTELWITVDYNPGATKLLVALSGQSVDGTPINGTCPTPTGTVDITGTPTAQTAGTAFTVCVYAAASDDTFVDTATNLVSISSNPNDPQGTYPADANLVAGKKDFSVTLKTSGSYTISAAASGLTTGTSSSITINPDATSKLVITSNPTTVVAGVETTQYVVQRQDQFGNPTTSGTQQVNLSSNSTGGAKQFRDTSGGGAVTFVTIGAGVSTENFFYYDEKAGGWTISVAYTGLTGDSKSLTVDPASASTFTVTTEHSGAETANVSFSATLTAKDAYNNTVSSGANNYAGSHTINWTWTATNSPNDNVAPTKPADGSQTFTNGVATISGFTLTNASETPTITATEPSGPSGTSDPITVNPGSTTKLVITTNPASVTAGSETTQYIVQRRDAVGNPTTSGTQQVDLSSDSAGSAKQFRDTSGGGSVTFVTIADSTSTEDFYYYDEKSGSWTISVDFSGLTGDSKGLTVDPAAASTFTVTTQNGGVETANISFSVTLTAKDAYGNTVSSGPSNYTGSHTINWTWTATSSPNDNVAPTKPADGFQTFTNGVATISGFTFTNASETPTITATEPSGPDGTSSAITVNPGSTTKLVITTNPASVVAGVETTEYIVQRRDAVGNPTTSSTQQVDLSSDSTGGAKEFRDTSGGGAVTFVTIADSASTENFFYYDEKSGSWTISTDFSGLTGDSKALTVDPAAATTFAVTTENSGTETANVSFSVTLTAKDAFGNTVSSGPNNYTGSKTINWTWTATSSPNDNVAPTKPADGARTFTNGVLTLAGFTLTDASETPTITGTDPNSPNPAGTSAAITANPGSTTKLVLTTWPTSVNVDTETTQYIVQRRDAVGNPTTSGTQQVDLSSNSTGTYQFRDTSGGGAVTFVTIADGVSTENFFYSDDTEGTWTISVAYTGLTGDSKGLNVIGAKFWLVLPGQSFTNGVGTTGTAIVTANQSFSVSIYKTDGNNNLDTSYSGSHTINWTWTATNSPNEGVAPTKPADGSQTFTNGVATISGFTLTNASETPTITATEPSGPDGTSSAITVNPGSTTKLVITTNPSSVTAGQETTQYVVQRRDDVGNPTTSGTQQVDLSSDSAGSAKEFRDTSSGGAVTFITIADTASTEDFYYYDEKAGGWTISVSYTGLTGDSKALTVDPATASTFTVTTENGGTEVAGTSFSVTLNAKDAFGNTVSSGPNNYTGSHTIDWTWTATNSPNDTAPTKPADGARTFTDGVLTLAGFTLTNAGETPTITGTEPSGPAGTSSAITINPAAVDSFTVTTQNGGTEVAGTSFSVTLTTKDSMGNTVSSGPNNYTGSHTINWTWTATNSPNDTAPTKPSDGARTFTNGVLTLSGFTLTNSGETPTITGTEPSGPTGTSAAITVNPGTAASFTVTTEHSGTEIAGTAFSVTLTAKDAYGNIVSSGPNNYTGSKTINWTWTATSSPNNTAPTKPANGSQTFTNGVATVAGFTLTDAGETPTITATDPNSPNPSGTSAAITVRPAAASTFTVTTQNGGTETANVSFSVTLTAKDTYGNTVSSGSNNYTGSHTINWTWTATNSPNDDVAPTKPADGSQTFTNGVATISGFTLTNASETPTITATEPSGPSGTSDPITVSPGSTSKLVITTNPASVTAGSETTQYIVQRRDNVGNPTTSGSQTVNLSSNSTGGKKKFRSTSGGGAVSSVTIPNGSSTKGFYYYDELVGSWTISVSYSGLTGDSKGLTVNPAATAKLIITTNPTSVTAGQETTQYVVERRDQFNNVVSSGNQTVNLSSSSTGSNKEFRDTSSGSSVTQITITNGNTTEDFYYYDEKSGSWTISVSATGKTGDSKSLTVNPDSTTKLVINTVPASVEVGVESGAFVVQRQDQFGNATTSGTQQVDLSADSTGIYEFRDTSGGAAVTFVIIGAGASTENFFYLDDTAGTWTISVSATGKTGDSKSFAIIELVAPSGFGGTALSTTSIRWSWTDNSAVEDGFRLYDGADNLIVEINTPNTTSYDETGLTPKTFYTRYVRAFKGITESGSSSLATVKTKSPPPPPPEEEEEAPPAVAPPEEKPPVVVVPPEEEVIPPVEEEKPPEEVPGPSFWERIVITARSAVIVVRDFAETVLERTGDLTSQLVKASIEAGREVAKRSVDTLSYIAETSGHLVRGLGDQLSSAVEGGRSLVVEVARTSKRFVGQVGGTVKDSSSAIVTTATRTVKAIGTQVTENSRFIVEGAVQASKRFVGQVGSAVRGVSSTVATTATGAAKAIGTQVTESSRRALVGVRSFGRKVGETSSDFATHSLTRLRRSYKESVKIARQVAQNIARGLTNAYRASVQTVGTAGEAVARLGTEARENIDRVLLGVDKFREVVFETEPMVINDVRVEIISNEEVVIAWWTNHLSTSKVNYGSALGVYEFTAYSSDQTRDHRLVLSNLRPNTKYFYEIISKNRDFAVDAFRSFTTPK